MIKAYLYIQKKHRDIMAGERKPGPGCSHAYGRKHQIIRSLCPLAWRSRNVLREVTKLRLRKRPGHHIQGCSKKVPAPLSSMKPITASQRWKLTSGARNAGEWDPGAAAGQTEFMSPGDGGSHNVPYLHRCIFS